MESHAHRLLPDERPPGVNGPVRSNAAIDELFDDLVDDLRGAVTDPIASHRLEAYKLSARITVAGSDHLELFCTLNGSSHIDTRGDAGAVEITLTIEPSLLEEFWDRHLALEILRGNAKATGQVRRLLTIMPVLRAAVRRNKKEAAR